MVAIVFQIFDSTTKEKHGVLSGFASNNPLS